MPGDEINWPLVELAAGELRTDETVIHHWPAPAGMAVLTQERCGVAGHPRPVHRQVLWSENFAEVQFFEVWKAADALLPGLFGGRFPGLGGRGGVAWDPLDEYFTVVVDRVPVHFGYIDHCEMI